jgi:uncharacterized protein YgbK (DUF1537 family)
MSAGKPTALNDVSVFFLSLLSREIPVLYFDEATVAVFSVLSTSSLINHHTFLVVKSGILKEF